MKPGLNFRYFGDAWQALPRRGYTRIFENMMLGRGEGLLSLSFTHKWAL